MFFKKAKQDCNPELINIPLIVISANGVIHDINAPFCEIVSQKREVLAGRNYNDITFLKPVARAITNSVISKKEDVQRFNIGEKYFEVSFHPFSTERGDYTSVFFYDITPFLEIEKELLKRNRELMIINTLSGAFISSENIESVFNDLLEKVMMITDFTTGWIMFNTDGAYVIRSSHGISKLFHKRIEEGDLSDFCRNIETVDDPLYIYEEDDVKEIPLFRKEGIVILAAVPIKIGKRLKGIMFLASRVSRTFDFNLASILSLIGSQLTLIIEKIELFEETKRLSITDSLTGLFNSRHFYESLEKEIARAARYKQVFSLAIFDIDDFKVLNDTYGHQVGDEVLRKIAAIMRGESRETDVIARYGGEEFVIIFPNTPKKDALAVSERILKGVKELTFSPEINGGIKTTISGGISSYPDDGKTIKDLLYTADMAMYRAKSTGKKQVVCYNIAYETDIQKAGEP